MGGRRGIVAEFPEDAARRQWFGGRAGPGAGNVATGQSLGPLAPSGPCYGAGAAGGSPSAAAAGWRLPWGCAAAKAETSARETNVARSPAVLRAWTFPAPIQRTRVERATPTCAAAMLAGIQPAARSGEPSGASNTAKTRARCFGESPLSASNMAAMAARVASDGMEELLSLTFIMRRYLRKAQVNASEK